MHLMDRAEQEIAILEQIGEILGSSLEPVELFGRGVALLEQQLGVRRAALVVKDEAIDRLRIGAAVGLTDDEQRKCQYEVGKGPTGQVVSTAKPRVVAYIAKEPGFLNRTGILAKLSPGEVYSFIGVPIKIDSQPVGALTVYKPY